MMVFGASYEWLSCFADSLLLDLPLDKDEREIKEYVKWIEMVLPYV